MSIYTNSLVKDSNNFEKEKNNGRAPQGHKISHHLPSLVVILLGLLQAIAVRGASPRLLLLHALIAS
jgi:hypothetical protein